MGRGGLVKVGALYQGGYRRGLWVGAAVLSMGGGGDRGMGRKATWRGLELMQRWEETWD